MRLRKRSLLIALMAAGLGLSGEAIAEKCPETSSPRLEYLAEPRSYSDKALQSESAAAIIGSLGLTWRTPCDRGRAVHGYISPRSRYCLLLWGCTLDDTFGRNYRACLVDSCGMSRWTLDVESDADAGLSSNGTVAFMSRSAHGDSTRVGFVGPDGRRLGTWSTTRDSLEVPHRWSWSVREFLPHSQDLAILSVGPPRDLASLKSSPPSLRLISSTGEQRWSHHLQSPNCNRLYLSPSGALIVAYGPIAYGNSGETTLSEHEIQVFNKRGDRIAHIRGRGEWELLRLAVDSNDRLLYYDAGTVTAFDLIAGKALPSPPEQPLVRLSQSDDPETASMASALLERLTEYRDAPKRR